MIKMKGVWVRLLLLKRATDDSLATLESRGRKGTTRQLHGEELLRVGHSALLLGDQNSLEFSEHVHVC